MTNKVCFIFMKLFFAFGELKKTNSNQSIQLMKRSLQIKASKLILTLHTFYRSQSTLSIDGNDSVEHVVDWDEVEQLA